MTIEGFRGADTILLSYDVSGSARSTAARVCQIVFGRSRPATDGTRRQQTGFLHRPGVIWIGQSVLLLPKRDATELSARLRSLGVRVAMGHVTATRQAVEPFRRPH